MSSLENRAWLTLWTMCPAYVVYFAVQALWPEMLPTFLDKIALLSLIATLHAIGYIVGLQVIRHRERGAHLLEDERDRAIDARATRAAYFILLTGMILVGMVMPFARTGWQIVNAALLVIVLTESARHVLIITSYRQSRLAY